MEAGVAVEQVYNCHNVVLELEPMAYRKEMVRATRKLLGASQQIFAQFLGVSVQAVQAWEQGRKEPKDVACRFMDEIRRDPRYWQARLRELIRPKAEC